MDPPLVLPHPMSFPGGGGGASLGRPKIFRCGSLCCCVGDCVVGHCHLYPLYSWHDILLTFAEMELDSTTMFPPGTNVMFIRSTGEPVLAQVVGHSEHGDASPYNGTPLHLMLNSFVLCCMCVYSGSAVPQGGWGTVTWQPSPRGWWGVGKEEGGRVCCKLRIFFCNNGAHQKIVQVSNFFFAAKASTKKIIMPIIQKTGYSLLPQKKKNNHTSYNVFVLAFTAKKKMVLAFQEEKKFAPAMKRKFPRLCSKNSLWDSMYPLTMLPILATPRQQGLCGHFNSTPFCGPQDGKDYVAFLIPSCSGDPETAGVMYPIPPQRRTPISACSSVESVLGPQGASKRCTGPVEA